MNKCIVFLIVACTIFTSCKDNHSNKPITLTMVNCMDGSYYYTSQDYICGCENSELNYAVYNVPVKTSAIHKKKTNYRKFTLKEPQIIANNKLQRSGNICSCTCNGTSYTIMNTSSYTCGEVCAIVCNKFHESTVKDELALD